MVNKKRIRYYEPPDYSNISILLAFARVFLGMLILLGSLVILDIFVYLGVTGNNYTYDTRDAYDANYTETYFDAYKTAYTESYQSAVSDTGREGTSGSMVVLKIPTFEELSAFLSEDTTDTHEYIEGEYACFEFTADLNNIAASRGIRAAYVSVRGEGWAHALVAFDTLDKGLVFVEPQSDKVVEFEIGKPYPWWMAGAMQPSLYDNPVEEIRIIW